MEEYNAMAPSGAVFPVLTEEELDYFEEVTERYQQDNHFKNIADLQDLDRIINLELLCYRWNIWLTKGVDYDGLGIVEKDLIANISEFSKEIRYMKKQLGVDKVSREKDKGETVADYIENLRLRAREFQVLRFEQATKAITTFKQLEALCILNKNCTPEERRENRDLKAEMEDIFDWIIEIAIPDMNAIDEKFRENQKMWIRQV